MPGNDRPGDKTKQYQFKTSEEMDKKEVILYVYKALKEKGYNPINQIVGYLISGDPAYITSHDNARDVIKKVERDELLTEIVTFYLNKYEEQL